MDDWPAAVAVHHVVNLLEEVAQRDGCWSWLPDVEQFDDVPPEVWYELHANVGVADAVTVGAGDHGWQSCQRNGPLATESGHLSAQVDHEVGAVAVVADDSQLAEVDDRYRLALEVAAGGRLSQVVVDDDRIAARAIELLARELGDPILADRQNDFLDVTKLLMSKRKLLAEVEASIAMSFSKVAASKLRAKTGVEANIRQLEARRNKVVESFRDRLGCYGVTLSQEQAEVLLSRIDSSDVGQMAVVFALMSRLASQLAAAKAGSSENLDVARKYYGIYLGLLELQLHLQSQYIDNVNEKYLPGVDK
ncbi:MAG: hypothetical protein EBZ13_09030, partial [Planctomycetia bacterium]|nr:hypothetical protein [Planctomycetia bacterium]